MLKLLRHLFLPHETNNHRAKILHPSSLTILLSLLLVIEFSLTAVSKIRPDILGFATDISVGKLLEETNQKRLANGLAPLTLNEDLNQAAAGKAADMFGENYWAHVSPSGKTPWDFILGAHYQYVYAGENLAKDFQDAPGVVNAWMNSPSHRENVLQPKYQDVGFAVVNGRLEGEETTLVVQMFGTRQEGAAQQVPPPSANVQEQQVRIAPVVEEVKTAPQKILAQKPVETVKLPEVKSLSQNLNLAAKNSDAVVRIKPKFDILALSKNITAGAAILLILVLGIDAVIISRKKIVRISGDSLAHILFLSCLIVVVWLVGRGSVI